MTNTLYAILIMIFQSRFQAILMFWSIEVFYVTALLKQIIIIYLNQLLPAIARLPN